MGVQVIMVDPLLEIVGVGDEIVVVRGKFLQLDLRFQPLCLVCYFVNDEKLNLVGSQRIILLE